MNALNVLCAQLTYTICLRKLSSCYKNIWPNFALFTTVFWGTSKGRTINFEGPEVESESHLKGGLIWKPGGRLVVY